MKFTFFGANSSKSWVQILDFGDSVPSNMAYFVLERSQTSTLIISGTIWIFWLSKYIPQKISCPPPKKKKQLVKINETMSSFDHIWTFSCFFSSLKLNNDLKKPFDISCEIDEKISYFDHNFDFSYFFMFSQAKHL